MKLLQKLSSSSKVCSIDSKNMTFYYRRLEPSLASTAVETHVCMCYLNHSPLRFVVPVALTITRPSSYFTLAIKCSTNCKSPSRINSLAMLRRRFLERTFKACVNSFKK